MIPRNNLHWLHKDYYPFGRLGCYHLACVLIQWAGIAFKDGFTYPLDGLKIITDDRSTLDLHASQLLVLHTRLNQARKPGITSEVHCLL